MMRGQLPLIMALGTPAEQEKTVATNHLTRRDAVKLGVVAIAGAALGAATIPVVNRVNSTPPTPYRFFTDAEATLLVDLCEQLIPRDDAPGATDANVIGFIDRQLAGRYARHQAAYRRGLDALQRTCRQVYGQPFARLTPEQKSALVHAIESGRVPKALWGQPTAPAFFTLVLSHTMQGFYGSPRHGGNRDFVSYRMLGLALPQVVGRNVQRAS